MHVMSKSPLGREHTTTPSKLRTAERDWKALLAEDADLMREIVRAAVTEVLEVEMSEALGAQRGERTEGRLGYRAGYYPRSLVTRVGIVCLEQPRIEVDGAVAETSKELLYLFVE
jgi:transposase-like protein